MRESLIGFAQNIDIPGAPVKDDQSVEEFDALMAQGGSIETGLASHHILLMQKLQKTMETPYGRLMVFMPPGGAKSTFCSVVAPTWYMGKYPRSQIILASYGTDLAKKHGAKGRIIVSQPNYIDAFDTTLSKGSGAKEMWSLDNGSEYMSGGLLSGITGNRAIGVILDDPIKGRQDAESKTIREATMAALEDDLQTRYIPGAWMILVQCLTAETPVRMADGSERPLVDIEPYDRVASYDEGRLVAARVAKKRLSGHDSVYKITTTSGRIVRGNERHPFLVETPEGVRWVRIKNLKAGDSLVSLKDVTGQQGRKLDLENVRLAKQGNGITAKTRTHQNTRWGITENGKARNARQRAVPIRSVVKVIAPAITTKRCGLRDIARRQLWTNALDFLSNSSIATALRQMITTVCWQSKAASARFAEMVLPTALQTIGATVSPLTIVTIPARSGGFCAIPATSPSDGLTPSKYCDPQFDTSSFTTDTILTIEPDGVEDVYDLEIEGTHNFIASGLVTHNTRWHDEDVAGSLLPENYAGESGPIECRDGLTWEVINLKAKIETEDDAKKDPLGRCVGEYLWPEWFDANHWKIYEPRPGDPNSPSERRWQALFQQNPRPDSSNQWERDWVNWYELGKHPKHLNFYTSSDYSVSDGEGDYTEHGVAGLDQHGDLWLVDWWYGQTPPDISIDALLRLAKRWGATHGFDERGLIEKAIKPAFMMRQRQMNIFMHIEYLPTVGNKIARFQSFRHMGSSGKVWIPRCPWGERLVDQLCSFRAGSTRDDAVDVCSGFGRGLNDMMWSREKVPEEKKKGLVFGSWAWVVHGTEPDDDEKTPRVF